MPVETRTSLEFGGLVAKIMGGDSIGKASIKTNISDVYLLKMRKGRVPSRQIVERFAALMEKLYPAWAKDNEELVDRFVKEFTLAFNTAVKYLGIRPIN